MDVIRAPISSSGDVSPEITLSVDRHTLAKRRWRGVAGDGREFGFDLDEPLHDGESFFKSDAVIYRIAQKAEPVLEIPLSDPADSARLGWLIGNLHFSLEIEGTLVRVVDDSALRQMLDREQIAFSAVSRVFHPVRHGHVH